VKVVLAICGTRGYYGLPKYFYFLAKHLIRRGIEVEVIVDSPLGAYKLYEVVEPQKYPEGSLPISSTIIRPTTGGVLNIVTTPMFCRNVAKYLNRVDFDILHTCHIIPYFYLKQRIRKPVIFQPFGNELFYMGGIKKLFHPVLEFCGKKADLVVAEREVLVYETARLYGISKDKIFVLPVGIDSEYIKEKAEGTREGLGIGPDTFVILSVNSLHPWKGISDLVRAFRYVEDRIPDSFLIIIGSGPEELNIRRLVKKLRLGEKVAFGKDIPEDKLYKYYKVADVFVSPTYQKDFIMGILEAEVFGLPIVSTGQDWLINGNGFVVEHGGVGLANGILGVHERDRKAMGEISKTIVKDYEFEKIADDTIQKYKELLG